MTDGAVCLAYVHSEQVAHSWHLSVMDMLAYDVAHSQQLVNGGFMAMRCGTGGIVEARNQATAKFLDGDAEWLLWVDTDMGFPADALPRLLASADPTERPIVGGLCFSWREYATDGMGGFRTKPVPTIFRWAKADSEREGFTAWLDYPRDEVVQCAATGSAFILIHRDALTKVGDQYGPNWYARMTNPTTGQLLSEDLSFCAKAVAAGYPIHVDTRVKTSHMKTTWVSEDDFAWSARD